MTKIVAIPTPHCLSRAGGNLNPQQQQQQQQQQQDARRNSGNTLLGNKTTLRSQNPKFSDILLITLDSTLRKTKTKPMHLSKSARNSALLIAEKILLIGFGFIVSILLARKGGPDLFGQYAYITSFASIFAPLCIMGLNNIVTRYVVKYPSNSHYYVSSAIRIRLWGAFAAIIIGSVCAFAFGNNQNTTLIFLLLICQASNALLVYEYFYLGKQQVYKTLRIRVLVATFANIAKLTVIFTSLELTSLVLIQGLELLAIGALYHWQYRSDSEHDKSKRTSNNYVTHVMLHKGKWLLLSGLAAVIYMKIDQVMLANMIGNQEVAYYAAAAKLSEFWYAFPILIANAYHPKLIEQRKRGNAQLNLFIKNMLSALIAAALIISLITLGLSDVIIALVYGDQYAASSTILSIHIFASIFIFQRAIFSKWLIMNNLLPYSLMTHGLGALINILLNYLLIPQYQGIGAAWATLISYATASFVALFFSVKTRPFAFIMVKAMLQWPALGYKQLKKTNTPHG